MKLVLKSTGSSEPFSNYLKKFGKLRKSLLLEIDSNFEKFVSKSYSEDHSVVRSSTLSFSDANFEIIESDKIPDNERIKLGIVVTLDKFIKILDRFDSDFQIAFDFDRLESDNGMDYVCQSVEFRSLDLEMCLNGSKISEFQYLSDDIFNNRIFNVTESVTINVPFTTLQNIIKTSDIVAIDPKKDSLIFYTANNSLWVKDNMGKTDSGTDKKSNFTYCIAPNINVPDYPVRLPISREKFVQVLSGSDEDFNFIIGKDVNGELTRILFDSQQTDTKIVISTLNEG